MYLIIVIFSLIELTFANPNDRVVNGTDARIEEFPFMVSLRRNGAHTCGGTIINQWFVLTAAHCVQNPLLTGYTIQYGSTFIERDSPNIVGVEAVFPHEDYNFLNQYIHDIALIKVRTKIDVGIFDYKIKLPSKWTFFPTGTKAVLAGWGFNETSGVVQTTLQKVDLKIYSSIDCAEIHTSRIHPTNLCAGVEGGYKGQCNDNGGPLMVNGVQVAIVSWSVKPCAAPPYPGVYTATSPYIAWIEKKVGAKLGLNTFVQA